MVDRQDGSELDQLLSSAEFFANPYPVYHALRTHAPVYWSEYWKAWVFTRYDDVVAILRDVEHFGNHGRVSGLLDHLTTDLRKMAEPLDRAFLGGLVHSDPPDHTRLRKLIGWAFTASTIRDRQAHIQRLVDDLLDKVQAAGTMDVVHDLAHPLSATVISELLGVPAQERQRFNQWSVDIFRFLGGKERPTMDRIAGALQSQAALERFALDLAAQRRQQPQADLMSYLVAAEDSGDRLSEAELLAFCSTFLSAGHETTTSLIASGLYLLLCHPDQLRLLQANPSLIDLAVEEFLRYESPLQRDLRTVRKDIELAGNQLRQGQAIFPMLGAANHDPAQFPDPDRVDITRANNRHIAFGYGLHYCVGAPLARLEAQVAIRTVVRRMPGLRLVNEVADWGQDIALRSLKSLPVTF